mmetsp:Transcript_10191/g.18349  ORF Transcript_10191/g.18349 Transcript_10191/m.18349 type:complete len:125 (+) Transcript_10191:180-554(+)
MMEKNGIDDEDKSLRGVRNEPENDSLQSNDREKKLDGDDVDDHHMLGAVDPYESGIFTSDQRPGRAVNKAAGFRLSKYRVKALRKAKTDALASVSERSEKKNNEEEIVDEKSENKARQHSKETS